MKVMMLTNERHLTLFSMGTLVRDHRHPESPSSSFVERSYAVVITTTPLLHTKSIETSQ